MSVSEITDLYAYTEWANDRMFAAVARLSDDQYTRELTSSYPTVRDTLGHIVSAEWIWLQRWNGTSPASPPPWTVAPAVTTLEREMRAVIEQRRAFLATLDDESLARPLSYRTLGGSSFTNRLFDVLLHVVNHSSYHRGQLTTMLRQVGAEPPSTDLILFRRLP